MEISSFRRSWRLGWNCKGPSRFPYAEDWLKVARRDWRRIHVLLNDDDADGAGFFLQQGLEKYLKAFLLQHGWKLKKVHTLQSLLDEAATFAPDVASLRPMCERVS